MSTRTATPTAPRPRRQPQFDSLHNLKQTAIRLGLQDPDKPESKVGERWLRDGCNRPENGSKGPRFPHFRMGRSLVFSDSQIAYIAEMHLAQAVPDRKRGALKSAA